MNLDDVIFAIIGAFIAAPSASYMTYLWAMRMKLNEEKMQVAKDMVVAMNDLMSRITIAFNLIEKNQIGMLKTATVDLYEYFKSENFKRQNYIPRLVLRKELDGIELDGNLWNPEIPAIIEKALNGEIISKEEVQNARIELKKTKERITIVTDALHKKFYK